MFEPGTPIWRAAETLADELRDLYPDRKGSADLPRVCHALDCTMHLVPPERLRRRRTFHQIITGSCSQNVRSTSLIVKCGTREPAILLVDETLSDL